MPSSRNNSRPKSAGIRVAARRIDVIEHLPASFDSIVVGSSPRMRTIFDFIRLIADSESNVLIVGETGTGKETIAGLIQQASRRRSRAFLPVRCGDPTETTKQAAQLAPQRVALPSTMRAHASG